MYQLFDTIRVESDGYLALVTLNRPEVANAFNTQMAEELRDFFLNVIEGSRSTRCVILTGTGIDEL